MTADQLAAGDAEILAFERERFAKPGRKADAILRRFGHSETRYYQRLNAVIVTPAAAAYDPELVARLSRKRDARRGTRSAQSRGVTL